MLGLIVEDQAGLPLLMKPLSGNSSNATELRAVVKEHVQQLKEAHEIPYLVADGALYNHESLEELQRAGIKWLSRVPATLAQAKAALAEVELEAMMPLGQGYSYQRLKSEYGGVEQRWLLIYSQAARARAAKQVPKVLARQTQEDVKASSKLSHKEFACIEDAKKALEVFTNKLKACTLSSSEIIEVPHYQKAGRPAKDALPSRVSYRIEAHLSTALGLQDERLIRESCFILATSELDEEALPDHQVFEGYQAQSFAERGFRFRPHVPGLLALPQEPSEDYGAHDGDDHLPPCLRCPTAPHPAKP